MLLLVVSGNLGGLKVPEMRTLGCVLPALQAG